MVAEDQSHVQQAYLPSIQLPSTVLEMARKPFQDLTGLWAIEPSSFGLLWTQTAGMDFVSHFQQVRPELQSVRENLAGPGGVNRPSGTDIAVITIGGVMTKHGSSLGLSTSMIQVRREIRQAVADPAIGAIILLIDSPGGTIAGTKDLAEAVWEARQQMPVVAFYEDLGASAACWVGSQATKVYANNDSAKIGSLGVFQGVYDQFERATKEGIIAYTISTGGMKSAGWPGTKITEDQIEYWQELVDHSAKVFADGIMRGRGLSRPETESLFVGRIWPAPKALELGLLDGIQTFEQTVEELSQQIRGKEIAMENTQPQAASLTDLKAACPNADSDFFVAALEKQSTVVDAMRAYQTVLEKERDQALARVKELEEQAADALQQQEKRQRTSDLVGNEQTEKVEPVGQTLHFRKLVEDTVQLYGMERSEAVAYCKDEYPDAYREFVNGYNRKHGGEVLPPAKQTAQV